ncbi:FeoA family protein [Nitrosophilus alvini]|uniref:FeoA family protein n=1 Tax=Nitrosophilus alvini TaxID=2714855 RepID=UPI00190C983B|nr:FeoA family protein [Nitrosophilus alvini]
MKLSDAKVGEVVKVIGFSGGCDEFKCRLEAMGFRVGDIVKIINKGFFGPLQIESSGSKIALCRGQAEKILVEKVESQKKVNK